jgi:hypothetical protein
MLVARPHARVRSRRARALLVITTVRAVALCLGLCAARDFVATVGQIRFSMWSRSAVVLRSVACKVAHKLGAANPAAATQLQPSFVRSITHFRRWRQQQ